MKIIFVAQNFQMGGIQKSLLNTLKLLSKESKLDIDVFVFGDGELIKDVPSNINIIRGNLILQLISTPFSEIKKEGVWWKVALRLISMICVRVVGSKKFYRYILKKNKIESKYDIAISYFNDVPNNYFNQGTNQMVDEFVKASKKIAWIHTDPIKAKFNKEVCKSIYENFNEIVCVSNACEQKFKEFLPIYAGKVSTVYNLFPIEDIKELSNQKIDNNIDDTIKLITVARMDNRTKQINKILDLAKKLVDNGVNNFLWYLVGDGPDLEYNKKYLEKLGISKYVKFLGNKVNPYPNIKNSDLFVLASAYEGYPMVVGEALILEVPVITTKYSSVTEQIINGKNGIISHNGIDGLYSILEKLISNPIEIGRIKNNFKQVKFNNEIAYSQLRRLMEI